MKLLLTATLATMMALPVMANVKGGGKKPGKNRANHEVKQVKEAKEKVGKNRASGHGTLTAEKQQAVEVAINQISSLKTSYKFESLRDAEIGLIAHGLVTTTGALHLKASRQGLDATLLNEKTLIENIVVSLKMVEQKESSGELRKEEADAIYQLADMVFLASNKSYKEQLSKEVKEDLGLVISMVAQANTMFKDGKIPDSYITMAREIVSLGVNGMAVKGSIREKMGENLYTKALKNCLNAA
ncbi:MAG: hypothetical protein MK008_03560 [Bdellovibrionales bacterium]|nr:hypothetical protein [Bdellovibrionales bacterium]